MYLFFSIIFLYCIFGVINYFIWRRWPNDIREDVDALACNLLWSFIWPVSWIVMGIVMFIYWIKNRI